MILGGAALQRWENSASWLWCLPAVVENSLISTVRIRVEEGSHRLVILVVAVEKGASERGFASAWILR